VKAVRDALKMILVGASMDEVLTSVIRLIEADSEGMLEYTREVYTEDGVFDRSPKLESAAGVDAIASFSLKPAHQEAIRLGLAHFGLQLIDLRGDEAIVTSYLQILHLDHEGKLTPWIKCPFC
jgi:hypothetical protein